METLGSEGGHGAKLLQLQARDAIDILKNRSNGEILAWLAFARSIEPDFQYANSTGCLPRSQVFGRVSEDLDADWFPEKLNTSQQDSFCQSTGTPSNIDPSLISNQAHTCFSPNPFSITKNPDRNWEYGRFLKRSRSRAKIYRSGNPSHLYWCTICGLENPHSYKASDQWKKHEKEHEFTLECLPTGRLEASKQGDLCALCREPSPDDQHFRKHNVDKCLKASNGPPTFKRRYQMVSHLQGQHACGNSEALAEKWRFRLRKQAWSCGFCIALFTNLPDRLKHIGIEHFEKHKTLHEWSSTKVIEGLLLQPEVNEAWSALLNTKDQFSRENLSWTTQVLPSLQRRLELGVTVSETAEELARATYELAEFDWMSHHAASEEVNDAAPNLRAPPPIAPQVKACEKPWNPTFVAPFSKYTNIGLPIAQSATRSWYSPVASTTPSLYTSASMSERQSDSESTQGEWPDMHRDDDGLAGMLWDDGAKVYCRKLLHSSLDNILEIDQTDTFDGLVTDSKQHNTGMQI